MKRNLFAILICTVMLLAGCKGEGTEAVPSASPSPEQTMAATPVPEKNIIAKNMSASKPEWSTVNEYSFDIDKDGEDEIIKMTTSAMSDDNGEIQWDDSQKWALEVIDGDEYYTLYYSKTVPGKAYFEVFQDESLEKNAVRLIVTSGADFSITEYEYVKDKKAFREKSLFEPITQNRMYTSLN